MRRRHVLLISLLVLSLTSLSALARTAPLSTASEDDAVNCPDVIGGDAAPSSKPTTKQTPAPATTKSKPGTPVQRGNGGTAIRTPRWHRFIPGMIR